MSRFAIAAFLLFMFQLGLAHAEVLNAGNVKTFDLQFDFEEQCLIHPLESNEPLTGLPAKDPETSSNLSPDLFCK